MNDTNPGGCFEHFFEFSDRQLRANTPVLQGDDRLIAQLFLLRFYREANILSCVRLKIHYSLIKKISLHSPIIVIMLNCFVVPKEKKKKKRENESKKITTP